MGGLLTFPLYAANGTFQALGSGAFSECPEQALHVPMAPLPFPPPQRQVCNSSVLRNPPNSCHLLLAISTTRNLSGPSLCPAFSYFETTLQGGFPCPVQIRHTSITFILPSQLQVPILSLSSSCFKNKEGKKKEDTNVRFQSPVCLLKLNKFSCYQLLYH